MPVAVGCPFVNVSLAELISKEYVPFFALASCSLAGRLSCSCETNADRI